MQSEISEMRDHDLELRLVHSYADARTRAHRCDAVFAIYTLVRVRGSLVQRPVNSPQHSPSPTHHGVFSVQL